MYVPMNISRPVDELDLESRHVCSATDLRGQNTRSVSFIFHLSNGVKEVNALTLTQVRNFYSHLITSCPVIQNFTLYAAHEICDTVSSWLGSFGKLDPEEHTFKALVSNGEGDDTLGLQGVGCGLHYTYCPPKENLTT